MGFAPIVPVSKQQSFEDFAYDYFESQPSFPPTTGINPFGKGIWRIQNGTRIHDNDASTRERGILTPIIQCCIDNPGDRILLYNLHSEQKRRETIDGIRVCMDDIRRKVLAESEEVGATDDGGQDVQDDQDGEHHQEVHQDGSSASGNGQVTKQEVHSIAQDPALIQSSTTSTSTSSLSFPDYSCGSMTEFVRIVRFKTRGPASIMFQPIYPANNPWEITGLVLSPMAWDEVFEAVFSSNMDGVHAVLRYIHGDRHDSTSSNEVDDQRVFTYTITNGRVESL